MAGLKERKELYEEVMREIVRDIRWLKEPPKVSQLSLYTFLDEVEFKINEALK
jgi:hypothetical protein